MGHEILYCGVCQTQLRGSEFEKGAAVRIGLEAWCKGCVPADRAAALQAAPPPERTPKRGSQRIPIADTPKRGSQRIPIVDTPRPRPSTVVTPTGRSGAPALWAAFIGGAAVIALVAVLASGSGPPPRPAPKPLSIVVEPEPPPRPPPPPAGPTPRELKALDSLKAARASGAEEDFARAVQDALGTPLEADARRGLEEIRSERRRVAEKAAFEAEAVVRSALDAEDFKRAGELAPARAAEFLGRADLLYRPLRDKALDAFRRGAKEEVEKARARVAAWRVGTFSADLDRELADAAKPAPPPPPDAPPSAEAVKAARDAAFERAAGRAFAVAAAELAKVKSTETGEDLELLKAAGAAHEEALKALAKYPKGRKLAFTVTDYDRVLSKIEGTFVRLHEHHVELLRGKSTAMVQLGHVLPRSFADLLPPKDRRAVAAACLLEGDEAGALELLKDDRAAVPPRWWAWAADFRRRHSEGPAASLERDLSYKFYEAAMRFPNPAARADGAMACAKIAKEHPEIPWVSRHLSLLESRVELAKDYVAGADLLRPGGGFRLETDRDRAYWISTADGDPARRREHFVEIEFSTLPDLAYRAWAYIGACCAETAAFAARGTDLPDGDDAPPVKHAFLAATKTHAGHGGKKQPSRWSWVEVPLPAYAAPGAKALRLATNQQGFSVAWIVVSATREKAPADADLKERDKDLPRGPGPVGPTLGMLAWFRADGGPVAEGGRVARWADVSGRLRHASQPDPAARPLYVPNGLNNKPAVRFDGERAFLSFDCPVGGFSSMTVVALVQASKNVRVADLGKGSVLQWRQSGPWGMVYLAPAQTAVAWRFGTAEWGNAPLWNRPNNEVWTAPLLVTIRKDGPREDLFVQGGHVLGQTDRRQPLAHTSDVAVIGAGSDDHRNPLQHWAGDVAEILVYSRALPEAERLAVEGYLRLKYGL